jgi:ubiquinone/menaquinone biosynthesis C-methylase UbiE
MDKIKAYYIKGEHYDWVTHPRRLEKIHHRLRERETTKLIKKYNHGSSVLDAGCGTGLITRQLEGSVLGLDINSWNLQQAKKHALNASFVLGDIENLPIKNCTLDLVVCTETLEHLEHPGKAISELHRVLKPGGRLIGSVPHRHLVWKLRKFTLTTCPVSEPFHHNYTLPEVRSLLACLKPIKILKGIFGLIIFFIVEKHAT